MSLRISEAQSFQAVIQKGHGEVIKTAQLSPDGRYLFTASRDKSAKVWDVASGYEIRTFLGHTSTVNGISFFENRLATSSADGTVAVWEIDSGKLVWQSSSTGQFMTAVAFSPDGTWLAAGGYVDSVAIFNTKDFKLEKKIRVNPDRGLGYGVSLNFSPEGKHLLVGEDQRTASLYRTSDWALQKAFKPESGYCGGCGTLTAFDPSGTTFVKLSNSSPAIKYDVETHEVLAEVGTDYEDIVSADFSSDGQFYLLAKEDSIWIFNTSNELSAALQINGQCNDASFVPGEKALLVAVDNIVLVLDFEGKELRRFDGILNRNSTGLDYDFGNYWEYYIAKWVKYKPARFLSDKSFFVGKTGNKARRWNTKSAAIEMEYIGHDKGVLCFEQVKPGILATGSGDGTIIIWDQQSGKLIKRLQAHREPIFDLAISNDGRSLASTAWDGTISIWNTVTWERENSIYNEGNSAYELAFSQNDAYLITALLDKTLRLLEVETGKFVQEFIGHKDIVTSIEVTENEILTSGWDGAIIYWDLYSGLIKRRIKHSSPIFAATQWNQQTLGVGADRKLRYWDRAGVNLATVQAHQAEITGLQIKGDLMMTTDVDGVTKFWNPSTRKVLYQHLQIGKNDWMVRTPEGFFDATDQAISNIHFTRGMEVLGADQVMQDFYVPGLAEKVFSSGKGKVTVGSVIDQSPPPKIKLSGRIQGDSSALLYMKAEDMGGGMVDLKLFHNDKQISIENRLQKSRSEEDARIFTIEAKLVAGLNEFSATASSTSGIISNRASVTLYSDSKIPGSVCHVLAVGINKYENANLNLNYARPDATSFSRQMKEQGSAIYSEVQVHTLYDGDASREKILNKVEALAEVLSINDVFIFYFAGHGSMVDGDFYLVSTEAKRLYDNSRIREYGIEAQELQLAMREIKALKQLVIMDACQSGGSVELIAQRGASEEKAIAQLSRSAGIHVMASAGSDQYATEFESLGHGLFTHALLKALNGEADGAPKDGKVTIFELKSYLDDQVPQLSIQYKGSPQYPHTFSIGQDFPVVILDTQSED
ncbi:MAG: caspase family protein [Bacteroidota bacterium]